MMQFNSIIYFWFALIAFGIWALGFYRASTSIRSIYLTVFSLVFYGWVSPSLVVFPVVMMLINYPIGRRLAKERCGRKLLSAAIILNLIPLVFCKYTFFLLPSLEGVFRIAVPMGISYFTFVQISYLVDASRGKWVEGFWDYALASVFWPKTVAGPIVRPVSFVAQWRRPCNRKIQLHRLYLGGVIFLFGLVKKLVLADPLGAIADWGYGAGALTTGAAWMTSVAYTLQLYFDFSGYSDMAWGSAIIFNIKLPWNFNSPYKATSIQDFWRRWHISLSQWLRDYLYFTFGGSRCGLVKTLRNVMLTFTIGGLWHGAGWTFIAWGAMHGAMLSINNLWKKFSPVKVPKLLGWALTLLGVHFAWVFFRAPTILSAWELIKALFGATGTVGYDWSASTPLFTYGLMVVAAIIAIFLPNTCGLLHHIAQRRASGCTAFMIGLACGILAFLVLVCGMSEVMPKSAFVYFQF